MEREIARWVGGDLEIEDHGWLVLSGHFAYGESGACCQGWGYFASPAFLMRFMGALGATSLKAMNGKSCWVTHEHDKILLVEPLHKKDGTPFDVVAWSEWERKQNVPTPYEMRTGEKP